MNLISRGGFKIMYSDFISINKNFQSSINLELDFGKESKIDEYIPTSDICDVLKKYIQTVLGINKDKATTLIGPYGKGKSFLLLVLSFLLGKNKNSNSWKGLLKKISKIDKELYDLLCELKQKNISLLPIIINSNYDNLTQSFQIALNDALKREGLQKLIPDSTFDICLSLLDKWEATPNVRDEVLKKCVELNTIDIKNLKRGLKEFSTNSYHQFEKLYNCVNIGLEFNPLINSDIVKIYSNISNQVKEYGYDGIFIIFDEFSKFLENNSSNLMKDLKIVQDFAELANRSGSTNQVLLCCVAHKSLSLYKPEKKTGLSIDSFKTVEGRFKEIRFNRSIDENYQIISYAITKKENAKNFINNYISSNQTFYDSIQQLSLFNKRFNQTDLFFGCFPINPITVYALIQISEYVAQNERTLFTFISDTDDDSLNSFIHSNSTGLFNVDKIYDYFYEIFKKENANSIRNIWYRTESILSKITDHSQRKIVKTLSIILMINDFDSLPPNENVISLSCGLSLNETCKAINSLIDAHLLRKNILSNLLSFALSNTKQIDELVAVLKRTKSQNIDYPNEINLLNSERFLLPRKYNENNKITRFFNVIFLTEDEFMSLKSLNYYFESNYCDGLVIYLLRNHLTTTKIKEKIAQIGDQRVIVKMPKEPIGPEFYEYVLNFSCLTEVKKIKGLDEITLSEIDLLLEETNDDIDSLIDNYFGGNCSIISLLANKKESLNTLLSKIMEQVYNVKLIFNNELINKRDVTTQYQKAINHVIDWLLDGDKEFAFSQTSPESSVKYSILDSNSIENISSHNFRLIINDLKRKIVELNGSKLNITDLILYLMKPPYGIRKGIIPVLLAKAISELSDNVILYYSSKEIELNSENIVKAISNDRYQISCSKGSIEQKRYLDNMVQLFEVESSDNFRKDTFTLANKIKKFFIGLPQIIRVCTENNNFLSLESDFLKLKSIFLNFDINPYDSLFVLPMKIKEINSYDALYDCFKYYKNNSDFLISLYKNQILDEIKTLFNIDKTSSLKSGFSEYLNSIINKDCFPVLESKEKSIYNLISLDFSYDDYEGLEKISKICTGQYIEDWDLDRSAQIIEELTLFRNKLLSSDKIQVKNNTLNIETYSNRAISGMASLLKNNIESVLDEFSDSVSSEDKVTILTALLKRLI